MGGGTIFDISNIALWFQKKNIKQNYKSVFTTVGSDQVRRNVVLWLATRDRQVYIPGRQLV